MKYFRRTHGGDDHQKTLHLDAAEVSNRQDHAFFVVVHHHSVVRAVKRERRGL